MAEKTLGTILRPYRWYILGGIFFLFIRAARKTEYRKQWGYAEYTKTRLFAMNNGVDFDKLTEDEQWDWYDRYMELKKGNNE